MKVKKVGLQEGLLKEFFFHFKSPCTLRRNIYLGAFSSYVVSIFFGIFCFTVKFSNLNCNNLMIARCQTYLKHRLYDPTFNVSPRPQSNL